MIIVKIYGGLGNQMFQYASAKRLAVKKGVPLKLYPEFSNDNPRKFRLKYFEIDEAMASKEEVDRLILNHRVFNDFYHKILRWSDRLKPYYKRRYYKHRTWENDDGILNASSRVFLEGYWYSEIFFKDIRGMLTAHFAIRDEFVNGAYKKWKDALKSGLSASVHIRRGDYEKNEDHKKFFGLLPEEYYQNSINYITEKYPACKFFVFSDDMEYAKKHLKFDAGVEYVEDQNLEDYHELKLMSLCRHNIIANSTFSWWAAWLNENPDKIVIAPKKWYNDRQAQRYYEQYPFVPDSWIKL